jgi:hypothetical protein
MTPENLTIAFAIVALVEFAFYHFRALTRRTLPTPRRQSH